MRGIRTTTPFRLAALALAVLCLLAGIVRTDADLVLGAGGALLLAGLVPLYAAFSGIHIPARLTTGLLLFCLACFVAGEWAGLYRVDADDRLTLVWDLGLHVISAAVLAGVGWALVLLLTGGGPPRVPLWVASILAVGFAALVGAVWELFEFSIDWAFDTNAQRSGLPDTMGDMAANLAGAAWGAVAVQTALRRGLHLPPAGLLTMFCAANPEMFPNWPGAPFPEGAARAPWPRGSMGRTNERDTECRS